MPTSRIFLEQLPATWPLTHRSRTSPGSSSDIALLDPVWLTQFSQITTVLPNMVPTVLVFDSSACMNHTPSILGNTFTESRHQHSRGFVNITATTGAMDSVILHDGSFLGQEHFLLVRDLGTQHRFLALYSDRSYIITTCTEALTITHNSRLCLQGAAAFEVDSLAFNPSNFSG